MKATPFLSPILRGPVLLVVPLILAACTTTAPDPLAPLPDTAPEETISSTIFPPEATPIPAPAVPTGISLFLHGEVVEFSTLTSQALDTQAPEILVRATPTTPYKNVARILEELHHMGYRVAFETQSSP